jgi:hypothetical protein
MADTIVPIVTALIGAAGSIAVTYIKVVIPLRQKNKDLTQKLEEPIAITRALAIGYFYNFLFTIGQQSTLEVLFEATEKRISLPDDRMVKFSKNDVDVVFIVPERLSGKVFDRVLQEVPKNVARIQTADLPGGFRVNYDFSEREGRAVLIIKDAVRPYFVIKHYAEDCLRMVENSSEWRKLENDTLKAFEEKVLELAGKGAGIFNNRISWKKIG